MVDLKKRLETAINEYAQIFAKKTDLEFEFWVKDRAGDIACFSNEWYVGLDTMRLLVDNDIPKHLFFDWWDQSLELGINNKPTPNFEHFLLIKGYTKLK